MELLSYLYYGEKQQDWANYLDPRKLDFSVIKTSYTYKGTPQVVEGTVRSIDQAISTKSLDTLEKAYKLWDDLHRKTLKIGVVVVLVSSTTFLLAVTGTLALHYLYVAALTGLVGAYISYRSHQASTKAALWVNPFETVQELRKKCDPENGGFAFLRQQSHLIGKIVHPEEIKHIWWETMKSLWTEFENLKKTNSSPEDFVKKFFNPYNPLAPQSVAFAFSNENENVINPNNTAESIVREQVSKLSNQFEKSFKAFTEIQDQEQNTELNEIKEERRLFLQKVAQEKDDSIKQYENDRDKKLNSLREKRIQQEKFLEYQKNQLSLIDKKAKLDKAERRTVPNKTKNKYLLEFVKWQGAKLKVDQEFNENQRQAQLDYRQAKENELLKYAEAINEYNKIYEEKEEEIQKKTKKPIELIQDLYEIFHAN